MKTSDKVQAYSTVIAGRPCHIVDGLADEQAIQRIEMATKTFDFKRTESDRPDTAHMRTFAAEVPEKFRKEEPMFSEFVSLVKQVFPGEKLTPYRTYINLMLYGDVAFPHRDCAPDRTDVTVLYYVNSVWKREWTGETLFFDDNHDARFAVTPRPGRTVIFRGAIEHRVGIPSRDCYAERLTLAYKFKAPGVWK